MTTEERIKMRENILAINEWCKENAWIDTVCVENIICVNTRSYTLYISKDGMSARSDDGVYLKVYEDYHDGNLANSNVGYEIVYNWKNVKDRIICAIAEAERKRKYTMEFVV